MCWRKIIIVFPNATSVEWRTRTMQPATDLDGSVDFGSFTKFELDGDKYRLSGEWGAVEIISDVVEVKEIAHETTDAWGKIPD